VRLDLIFNKFIGTTAACSPRISDLVCGVLCSSYFSDIRVATFRGSDVLLILHFYCIDLILNY